MKYYLITLIFFITTITLFAQPTYDALGDNFWVSDLISSENKSLTL